MFKKIIITILSILVTLIILVIGYSYYVNIPREITEYEGLKLDITAEEVFYRKGVPRMASGMKDKDDVLHIIGFRSDEAVKAEESNPTEYSKNIFKHTTWYYGKDKNISLVLKFDKPNGHLQEITCNSKIEYSCEMVNGIGINSTEDQVKKTFGKPSKEIINGLIKTIQYEKYNTEFSLEKEKVYGIKIAKIDN